MKDFGDRYIALTHIVEMKFSGIDDAKVVIEEFEFGGWSLDGYGGRSNIELYIKLIDGEEITICLGDYYVQIEDINSVQDDLKRYMKEGMFG